MSIGLQFVPLFEEFAQFGQLVALLPGQGLELLHALVRNEQLHLYLFLLQLLFGRDLRVVLAGIGGRCWLAGLFILPKQQLASGYLLS